MSIIEKIVGNIGRLLARFVPARNASGLFFVFPFFHVGGAERVHAEIANCFADRKPWVFFAKRSRDRAFYGEFARAAQLFNWWFLLKYTYPLSAGVFAGVVNRHEKATVFGCNSLFFYKMLPFLAPHVRRIDLLHAFGGGAEEFSLPMVRLLDRRVIIAARIREDLARQYRKHGVDEALLERVVLVENRVAVPTVCPAKQTARIMNILYVGRGTEEKRVHLVGRIAALCSRKGLPVNIRLVGDVAGAVAEADRPFCQVLGEVADRDALAAMYDEAHLLLLTSSREGFPLVIMEAMAHGVVPLTTDVGGISAHVRDGVNGWLVPGAAPEDEIVSAMGALIERACADRSLLGCMARAAHDHAREHFGGEKFCAAYRALLLGP